MGFDKKKPTKKVNDKKSKEITTNPNNTKILQNTVGLKRFVKNKCFKQVL